MVEKLRVGGEVRCGGEVACLPLPVILTLLLSVYFTSHAGWRCRIQIWGSRDTQRGFQPGAMRGYVCPGAALSGGGQLSEGGLDFG